MFESLEARRLLSGNPSVNTGSRDPGPLTAAASADLKFRGTLFDKQSGYLARVSVIVRPDSGGGFIASMRIATADDGEQRVRFRIDQDGSFVIRQSGARTVGSLNLRQRRIFGETVIPDNFGSIFASLRLRQFTEGRAQVSR